MNTLADKRALLTNACDHLGRLAALRLAQAGAHVIVHHRRGMNDALGVVEQIRSSGGKADAVEADLTSHAGLHSLVSGLRELSVNRLDVLVALITPAEANASAGASKASDGERHSSFISRASFTLVQQLLSALRTGSSVVLLPPPSTTIEASSEPSPSSALTACVRKLAALLNGRGVRVNAISRVRSESTPLAQRQQGIATDALADAVLYLSSDASLSVTGDVIEHAVTPA